MKRYCMMPGSIKNFAAAIVCALPTLCAAEGVALHSYDGSMSLLGELRSFGDGLYELETDLGTLLVSARLVRCEGADCPSPQAMMSDTQAMRDMGLNEADMPILTTSGESPLITSGESLDCETAAGAETRAPQS